MDKLREAAAKRAVEMPNGTSRPTERRAGEATDAPRALITRGKPQVRRIMLGDSLKREAPEGEPGPTGLEFEGLACATAAGYSMWDYYGEYTEVVSPGAFLSSLAKADLDVPLVIQHVDIRRIARTTVPAGLGHLELAEEEGGLMARATLDPADIDVAYIVPKIRAGLVDEMSFKFRITKGQWSPDWMEYHIEEVDIHRGDVAICGYGANPNTTAELRHLTATRSFLVTDADLR